MLLIVTHLFPFFKFRATLFLEAWLEMPWALNGVGKLIRFFPCRKNNNKLTRFSFSRHNATRNCIFSNLSSIKQQASMDKTLVQSVGSVAFATLKNKPNLSLSWLNFLFWETLILSIWIRSFESMQACTEKWRILTHNFRVQWWTELDS